MPGSELPVGAALQHDELPDGYFAARAEKGPGPSRRRGRAGIPVPNMGRAATSGTRQDQRAHRQVLEMVR